MAFIFSMLSASAQQVGQSLVLSDHTALRVSADMTSDLSAMLVFEPSRAVEVVSGEVQNGMIQVRVTANSTGQVITGWIPTENVETLTPTSPTNTTRETEGRPARNSSTAYAESVRRIILLKDPEIPDSEDDLVTGSLPVGTRVVLLDTQSHPEYYRVAVSIRGEIQRGWVPRAQLSTIPVAAPERRQADAPTQTEPYDQRRPDNEYCHNLDIPDSVRVLPTIGATIPNRVNLTKIINGVQVPCPELGSIPAGSPARVLKIEGDSVQVRMYSPQMGYIVGWLERDQVNLTEQEDTEAFCYNCAVHEETRPNNLRIQGTPDTRPGQNPGYQSDRYVGLQRADYDRFEWCNDHKSRLRAAPTPTFHSLDAPLSNGLTKKQNIIASGVDAAALANAYDFYQNNRGIIKNSDYMTIVDYSKRSTQKRYHVVNMRTGTVKSYYTHHGNGSETNADRNRNPGWARRFGNGERDVDGDGDTEPVSSTNLTSLGFSITGFRYYPSDYYPGYDDSRIPGQRMSLHGQTRGPEGNDNNCGRTIVTHPALDNQFHPHSSYWRSNGCPTVPLSDWPEVSEAIEGGSVFYQHN